MKRKRKINKLDLIKLKRFFTTKETINKKDNSEWEKIFANGICPGVGLLAHMAILFFCSLRNFHTILHISVPVYIPTNGVGGFLFLNYLSRIYFL